MIFCYSDSPIFVGQFKYKLGSKRWDLATLAKHDLLSGDIETLQEQGYQYCLGLADDESLLSLAAEPVRHALLGGEASAIVAQHCLAESAVMPLGPDDDARESRNTYFPAALLRELQLDHVPYFCSFASGCAGFVSLVTVAAGLFPPGDTRMALCFMADARPPSGTFDLSRERILGSDHSSAFFVGRQALSYQLLGVNYYSTVRSGVPLFEIVKRTVQMIKELAKSLHLDLTENDVVIHYPNIFPETWKMATRYLRLPRVEPVIDDIAERAHCGATDSVITLARHHRGQTDRLHLVVNYGIGLHLAICLLREVNPALRPADALINVGNSERSDADQSL